MINIVIILCEACRLMNKKYQSKSRTLGVNLKADIALVIYDCCWFELVRTNRSR